MHGSCCGMTSSFFLFFFFFFLCVWGADGSRRGKAVRLSYDHKGTDEAEGRRIAAAGGLILNSRVNGTLPYSPCNSSIRCIGRDKSAGRHLHERLHLRASLHDRNNPLQQLGRVHDPSLRWRTDPQPPTPQFEANLDVVMGRVSRPNGRQSDT